ncbi:hypothetical protein N825_22890 [Skermanella stibiiresistens SB22]|uniref:Uncharacterized protein n=1 Tax=Skermanella stibiiresistens SB22 TaxID=1385369 RepID=W9GWX8_9PROT|nr:hypothetical protein [Skermanella stibiiresistens]EWY36962.1 hypothetical protein N825_22890 [Skermanella stibiiresistens SB22]
MGVVELPGPLDLEGWLVRVVLLDVSLVDAPAIQLAETRFPAPAGVLSSLPFSLAIGAVPPRARLILSAEVRRDAAAEPQPGDLRNVVSIPWDGVDPRWAWRIPVAVTQ